MARKETGRILTCFALCLPAVFVWLVVEDRLLSWSYNPIWPVFYLMAKVRSTRERHSFMCIDFNPNK